MSDTISETKACDLLARMFRSRGYTITRNVTFREYGVEFHADGWDAKARVGFEFLSSEDEDHDDLTLAEYQTLMAAAQRGELALFVIDEVEPLSTSELFEAAEEFLDEVEAARRGATRPRTRAAAKAKRPAIKRRPAKTAKKAEIVKTAKKPKQKAKAKKSRSGRSATRR